MTMNQAVNDSFCRYILPGIILSLACLTGCRTPLKYRAQADSTAERILGRGQLQALGQAENIVLETPGQALRRRLLIEGNLPRSGPASLGLEDLPDNDYWRVEKHVPIVKPASLQVELPQEISLIDALQLYARNSPEYQSEKEGLYRRALALDLEADSFRSSFTGFIRGLIDSQYENGERVNGTKTSGGLEISRAFRNGTELAAAISVDLVRMLTQGEHSTMGILADASITVPLLRGSGWRVATADLTQAQKNLLYAVYDFEKAKRDFTVRVASAFYGVQESRNSLANAEENYRSLISSTRRARRLADAGRLPDFQFDQAVQDELKARDRWVRVQQAFKNTRETFLILLGLPPDAQVQVRTADVENLALFIPEGSSDTVSADYGGTIPPADSPVELVPPGTGTPGPLEIPSSRALRIALDHRLDLLKANGKIEDAQRNVYVAADSLRAELTLLGRARSGSTKSVSSADSDNDWPRAHQGGYNALLTLGLPFERTAERNNYRDALFDLNEAIREFQALEDGIKHDVLGTLRDLLQAREGIQIQGQAVKLAEKRVQSMALFLQAGRAQIRDLLDAEDDLLTARNALTSALVNYRVAELSLQRDLGVLRVSADGLFTEFTP